MTLEAIHSRLCAIGPTQMGTLGRGARRLLEEDLPRLIKVAKAASSLLSEDGVMESVSQFNVAFILRDAIAALEEMK